VHLWLRQYMLARLGPFNHLFSYLPTTLLVAQRTILVAQTWLDLQLPEARRRQALDRT
jgi:hypothetical protein